MNIFEYATRNKIRFNSINGPLTVEDIWDLQLTSKRGANLNDIGLEIRRQIKENSEDSLVEVRENKELDVLNIKFELIKHVIAVKQEEEKSRKKKADDLVRVARLKEALAKKNDAAIDQMSEEDLLKEIEKLTAS